VEEALTLFYLANTDQMVPRCSAATMPPPPIPSAPSLVGRNSNVPVTPVEEFMLPAGATARERPNPCTATPHSQAAPVTWPAAGTNAQGR